MDAIATPDATELGTYLRDRRSRLDPATLGIPGSRRRTPGLRREEVALRANISPTWYTWLEQGRGGAPSADVLERLARALALSDLEREHVFLLALGRPPEPRYRNPEGVTPRLQRVLGSLNPAPAMLRTATWDVIAWNDAATVMFGDYGRLPPPDRNILRTIFLDPQARATHSDWEGIARFIVGSFRIDAFRAGALAEVRPLLDELCAKSPDFAALWREPAVQGPVEYVKRIRHAVLGPFAFELSSFAVDGRPDLNLIVYNPATADDAARIRAALDARAAQPSDADVSAAPPGEMPSGRP